MAATGAPASRCCSARSATSPCAEPVRQSGRDLLAADGEGRPSAFDMSSHVGVVDDVYDGRATILVGDDERRVRVRLSGRLDPHRRPIPLAGNDFRCAVRRAEKLPKPVTLTIGNRLRAVPDHRTNTAGQVLGRRCRDAALRPRRCRSRRAEPVARRDNEKHDREHRSNDAGDRAAAGCRPPPRANRPTAPASKIAKPLAPWKTPCALACRSGPTSDEIHALPTPSVHPVKRP